MGTFQRKETVDARQFTGGAANGLELSLWVNSNGQSTEARAMFYEAGSYFNEVERIRIRTYCSRDVVYTGDWIVRKQDGSFEAMRNEDFISAGYVQA